MASQKNSTRHLRNYYLYISHSSKETGVCESNLLLSLWPALPWHQSRHYLTRPAGPVIRGSRGDLLLITKWGVERDEGLVRVTTRKPFWSCIKTPKCISQAQGLNTQAKGEVPFSRKDGAVELHKETVKYRYLSAGGMGQYKQKEKYLSVGGGAIELHILRQLHGEAGTWRYQGILRSGHLALT